MLNLIVNADDFGLSEEINKGIVKSYEEGILTSASIMTNGSAFNQAVELSKQFPNLDLGIHLTLVKEKPLLPISMVSSLVNDEGKFYYNSIAFTRNYFSRKIKIQQVEKELDLQIKTILECGLKISHLDSHQHLHMLPGIFKIVKKLSLKYQIPFIRLVNEKFRSYMFKLNNRVIKIPEIIVFKLLSNINNKEWKNSSNFFTGFFFDGDFNESNFLAVLSNLPEKGIIELMCHPGMNMKANIKKQKTYHSISEVDALTSIEARRIIETKNIKLVNYKDLIND